MIEITVSADTNGYRGLRCYGHAEYGDHGQDIICSAISLLTINTVNAVERLTSCPVVVASEDQESGLLEVVFPAGTDKDAGLLMDAYVLGVKGVMDAYGKKYVSLKIEGDDPEDGSSASEGGK